MPRMKPEVLAEFLQRPVYGAIATLRSDGMPYTVPIGWLWRPDGIWMTGTYNRVWCKQLLRDPRASLCIESRTPTPGHVEFDGRAVPVELPDFDIWPVCREILVKYAGRGGPPSLEAVDPFIERLKKEPRLLFRLEPEVTRAIDMSVYRGKRADREHAAGEI